MNLIINYTDDLLVHYKTVFLIQLPIVYHPIPLIVPYLCNSALSYLFRIKCNFIKCVFTHYGKYFIGFIRKLIFLHAPYSTLLVAWICYEFLSLDKSIAVSVISPYAHCFKASVSQDKDLICDANTSSDVSLLKTLNKL